MLNEAGYAPDVADPPNLGSLPGIIARVAAISPDRPCVALASGPEDATSYGQMASLIVDEVARLRSSGLTPGAHAALMLPRSVEYLVSYFAILACGGVVVPLGIDLTAPEIAVDLAYCDVTLAIRDAVVAERFPVDLPALDAPHLSSKPHAEAAAVANLADMGRALDPESLALLLHTSGTMSHPKRVMLSHRNVLRNAQAHGASVGAGPDDRVLIALPMHFGYCNTAQIVTHLMTSGSLYLAAAGFSPRAFRRMVARCGITTTTLVPTMLYALAAERDLAPTPVPSLRAVTFGGGPVDGPRLMALAKRLPGVDLIQTYGQTEAGPRLTTRRRAEQAPHSVGHAIAEVELSIRDETAKACPAGSPGEIWARGPGVMQGYFKAAEQTEEVFAEGWLRTGDIGVLSADGELSVVGRLRNTIIRGGQNIYPEQIEAVLQAHDGVAAAAVVGQPDPFQGEVPVALLVSAGVERPSEADLIAHCSARLARAKIPARFEWRDVLPRTYNQKIARGRLEEPSQTQPDAAPAPARP